MATHLTYGDQVYGNTPMVMARLKEAGIRHIRDGWGPEWLGGTVSVRYSGFFEIGSTPDVDPLHARSLTAVRQCCRVAVPLRLRVS